MFRLSQSSVIRQMQNGTSPFRFVKVGGAYRIFRESVEQLLAPGGAREPARGPSRTGAENAPPMADAGVAVVVRVGLCGRCGTPYLERPTK